MPSSKSSQFNPFRLMKHLRTGSVLTAPQF
jgi:hypothetical protein